VRLFDSRCVASSSDEAPGTVVGLEDGRLLVSANDGRLAVGKIRIETEGGDAKKVPAAEAGLAIGARLE
jgi:hypothetical protein